jgi:hypothetical protein
MKTRSSRSQRRPTLHFEPHGEFLGCTSDDAKDPMGHIQRVDVLLPAPALVLLRSKSWTAQQSFLGARYLGQSNREGL